MIKRLKQRKKILNDELLTVKKKFNEEVLMKKLNNDASKFIEQVAQDGVGVEEVRLLAVKVQSFKKSVKRKEKVIADMKKMMEKIGKGLKALK